MQGGVTMFRCLLAINGENTCCLQIRQNMKSDNFQKSPKICMQDYFYRIITVIVVTTLRRIGDIEVVLLFTAW